MSHSTNCRSRPIVFVDLLSYSTKCLLTSCHAPIKIVPPNANYGHSLGLQNFGIKENIEAFPVGRHPLVPMKRIAVFPCSFIQYLDFLC